MASHGRPPGLSIQSYSWAPSEYFNIETPVTNLSLNARFDQQRKIPELAAASFYLRGVKFESSGGGVFRFAREKQVYAVTLNEAFFSGFNPKKPLLVAAYPNGLPIRDWVSFVYFNKPYTELQISEKPLIETDIRSFEIPSMQIAGAANEPGKNVIQTGALPTGFLAPPLAQVSSQERAIAQCRAGRGAACMEAFGYFERSGKSTEGFEFLELGCKLQYQPACDGQQTIARALEANGKERLPAAKQ
jgi:hypothetical protein